MQKGNRGQTAQSDLLSWKMESLFPPIFPPIPCRSRYLISFVFLTVENKAFAHATTEERNYLHPLQSLGSFHTDYPVKSQSNPLRMNVQELLSSTGNMKKPELMETKQFVPNPISLSDRIRVCIQIVNFRVLFPLDYFGNMNKV